MTRLDDARTQTIFVTSALLGSSVRFLALLITSISSLLAHSIICPSYGQIKSREPTSMVTGRSIIPGSCVSNLVIGCETLLKKLQSGTYL
jgi:hypothetical protein